MTDTFEVEQLAVSLSDLEHAFNDNPGESLRHLRRWKAEEPDSFRKTTAQFLAETRETRFSRLLLHLLREDDESLESVLLAPEILSGTHAIQLAKLACRIDPKLPPLWANALPEAIQNGVDSSSAGSILRRLEILAACSDPLRLLPLVHSLCNHFDPHIRAMAVSLAVKLQPESDLPPGLTDTNTRVRATAIQAMWGRRDASAISRFEAHSTQPHHREAINALVGLHRAGLLTARQRLMELANQPDSKMAAAAIWAMGQNEDPRLLRFLQQSIPDASGARRLALLKAARQLKKLREAAESRPALQLQVRTLEALGLGRVQLEALLLDADGAPCNPEQVLPVHFLLSDGESPIDHCRIQVRGSSTPMDLLLLLPTDLRGNELKPLEHILQSKRREDHWCAQTYPVSQQAAPAISASIEFLPHLDRMLERLQPAKPAAGSLHAAIDRLIPSFPQRGTAKHLILLTSPNLPPDTAPARIWIERFERYGVSPHFIARGPLHLPATNGWRRLCMESGGTYTECMESENLGECLRQLQLSLNLSIQINCHVGRAAAAAIPLQIEYLSRTGAASITIPVNP